MAQSDSHPDTKTRQGQQHRQEISLLCPAAKSLEKLLLPKILIHIPFHPAQHGFRPKHSTCTALSTITADIGAGFSRKKSIHRAVLVELDLIAAFDNVDHQQLLDCVINTSIPVSIRRRLCNNMQNIRAKVHFQQQEKDAAMRKQEWCKVEFCLQRSSITIWPTFQHRLRTSS